jgi:tellurium resistance protein TerD
MALINCPDCDYLVSSYEDCPNCKCSKEHFSKTKAEYSAMITREAIERAKQRENKMPQSIMEVPDPITPSKPSPDELKEDDAVKCPKCRSTQIAAGNQGFGLGKAAVGGLLLGPVGLLGGMIGSKKIEITCLKCGHKWKPGG